MCREREMNLAECKHLRLDESRLTISWTLPKTKLDPRALGTTRTWGCVCDNDPAVACPFHALRDQLISCRALAVDLSLDFSSLPLFPTDRGTRVKDAAAVRTITLLATALGLPTVCPNNGNPLFGGHSLRTGGASALAELGISLLRIQAMGRWHSDLVIRYAGEKSTSGITLEARRGLSSSSLVPPSTPCRRPALSADHMIDIDMHTHEPHMTMKRPRIASFNKKILKRPRSASA